MHRSVISVILLAVLVPSVWLGVEFARQEYFKASVSAALRQLSADGSIIRRDVDAKTRNITLVVIGNVDEDALRTRAEAALSSRKIRAEGIDIRRPDADTWRQQIDRSLARDDAIELLRNQVLELQTAISLMQSSATAAHPQKPPHSTSTSKEK